jgi:uncharacterized repeat protein (TIGR01451 family)
MITQNALKYGERAGLRRIRMAAVLLFSAMPFVSHAAVAITTTAIIGYGAALNSDGWFLAPRSASSFPLNNSGVVSINTNFCFNQNNVQGDRCHTSGTVYPTNGFILTGNGSAYAFVDASGLGTSLQPDGFAINNIATLTYQRGPIFEGNPPYYQFFSLANPYANGYTVQSPADHRYALNLSTNSHGFGVTIDQDTSLNTPRAIRLNGDGTISPLAIPASFLVFDGFTRGAKILENNEDIYVALLNYDGNPQQYEIWRFAGPSETNTHSVVYSLPIGDGSLLAWDVNQSGTLVVAESNGQGQSVVKTIPLDGSALVVEGTQITDGSYSPGVFINESGLVAAVRAFTAGPRSGEYDLLYAEVGGTAVRVLGSGDQMNGGVILNTIPTSEMNEAGQLTIFMQLSVSPPACCEQLVVRVNPTAADLSLAKAASPSPVTVGDNLTYTIAVINNGPNNATGVTVRDTLPGGVTFVSATPTQGSCNGTTAVSCSLGPLSNGSSATVTIVVTPTQAGGISNTATVRGNETDPNPANNSDTRVTTVNPAGTSLSALSPAKLWVGQNDAVKQLKFDLRAEVLVNGNVVGSGEVANVASGGSDFSQANLDTVSLALTAATPVPAGATLSIRVSVRSSCSFARSGSGVARLWYNGQPIDSGKPSGRDAGSRFDATIGGTNSNYFLRSAANLATTAGTAREFVDVPVSDSAPCPTRPYTPLGTWGMSLQ